MPEFLQTTSDSPRDCQVPRRLQDFLNSAGFRFGIGAIVVGNIIVLARETDCPEWTGWLLVNSAFLLAMMAELWLRCKLKGMGLFFGRSLKDTLQDATSRDEQTAEDCARSGWMVFDLTLLVMGIVELWVWPLLIPAGSFSKFLECLRLGRLLRMFRLLYIFPRMGNVVHALLIMAKDLVWIFVVLAIILVSLAVILTQYFGGHPEAGSVADLFVDVPSAFFTLFRVTTVDNWMQVASPLISMEPAWQLFFVFFIVFASWTVISVLTAVASDKMVSTTTDRKAEELKRQQEKQRLFCEYLQRVFRESDVDGNGVLDKDEFEAMVAKDFVHHEMLTLGVKMTPEELLHTWDTLDVDGSGELRIDDFVSGLSYMQEQLSTHHIVNVEKKIEKVSQKLERRIDAVIVELQHLRDENREIIDSLNRQDATTEQRHLLLSLWEAWASHNDVKPSSMIAKAGSALKI